MFLERGVSPEEYIKAANGDNVGKWEEPEEQQGQLDEHVIESKEHNEGAMEQL